MRRAIAAACAAAGFLSLWTLMPRFDAALSGVRPALGREEAIQKAAAWARMHGVEISGWRFATEAEVDPLLARVRQRQPGSAVAQQFTPVRIRVLAFNDRGDAILATMTAEGRPLSFLDRRQTLTGDSIPDAAEQELSRLAGIHAEHFTRTADNVRTLEGSRSAWEWLDPNLNGMLARVVVVTRNGRVVNSSYEFSATREAAGEPPSGPPRIQAVLAVLTMACVVGIALLIVWMLFVSLQRRTDQFGFAVRFLWIPAAGLALAFLSGNYQNDALIRSFEDGLTGDSRLVFGITLALLMLLALFLLLAAAYAAVPRTQMRLWAPAALLVRGRWRNRQAAEQVWTGMAAGVLLGAAPYWVAQLTGEPRVRFLEGANLIMAPWPVAEAFAGLVSAWEVYAVTLFLYPWLAGRIRRRWLAAAAAIAAGTLAATLPRSAFPPGHAANFATAAVLTAGYLLVYRYGGMLGAWMAPLGMYAAVQGVRLAQMPAPSLEAAGWQTLAMTSGLAVAALGASFLMPEADVRGVVAEMSEAAAAPPRSQRDRLRAEFEVARRAQQDLLPAAAPQIPGFEAAAVCHPAGEVGGDLYDYLPCPHGRWMLCVADVSGKGLGAALHMTLLKGMLASAAHYGPPAAALASRLNQAVAETGRGRMFITLSLLTLDPAEGRAEHLRAGHNPPLVWRAQSGECEWRRPRGIGLGLTAGPAFESNLETETIEFAQGDVLVLYSDGVTEDMNPEGEMFGEQRLADLVQRHAREGPRRLVNAIMEEARAFRREAEIHDDWTLLAVQRTGGGAPGGKERQETDHGG